MAVNRTKQAMQRTALSVALGMCFSTVAFAQSNTAGAIFGQAEAGSSVQVTNPSTGFSRSITVGNDGNYRFSALPTGTYTVTYQGPGGTATTREGIAVSVGTGTPVNFSSASSSDAKTLDAVTVRGSKMVNPIDVSSVESATILTAQQLAKIPVARDTTSVALLAPGTVKGDGAFGNLASFGGSSVAENQYYVNGFNITNSFQSLNFAKIPFEAIAEQQIKTGGYGAEFGRSTGGVVNMITKSGSNEFHAGANVFWSPKGLQAEKESYYYNNPLVPSDNGKLVYDNSDVSTNDTVGTVWASGPLIKDKLFGYALVAYDKTDNVRSLSSLDSQNGENETIKNPTWLVKLDWNINDNNKLEFTGFNDKQKYTTDYTSYQTGEYVGKGFKENGGTNLIGKYTGYLTDTFTVSALYGHGEFARSEHLQTLDGQRVAYSGNLQEPATGCPIITDGRPGYRQDITGAYGSTCNITGASLEREDAKDTRDQWRIDAEWALGDHLIRFGYDADNYESVAGTSYEGGHSYRYSTNNGPDGLPDTGDEFDIVRERIVNQGSTVKVKQHAFYVEDSWHITENFIAYLGARWDTFENLNGQGQSYVKINNQFGPRLGFTWDVNGDSSLKIYGNAGRYALPLTPSVAVRGASASLFTQQNYLFTGVDPQTGAPLNTTPEVACSTSTASLANPRIRRPSRPPISTRCIRTSSFLASRSRSPTTRTSAREAFTAN